VKPFYSRYLPPVLLLAVEVVAFAVRFQAAIAAKLSAEAAIQFATYSIATRFAVTAAVVVLVFGGHRIVNRIYRANWRAGSSELSWGSFIPHLILAVTFYALSVSVLEGPSGSWAHQPLWIWIWLALGAGTAFSWVVAAFPYVVRQLLPAKLLSLSVSLAFGAVLFGKFAELFWPYFVNGTFWLVERMLGLFYPVVADADQFLIGTNSFSVTIAPKCSGLEGIALVLVFMTGFLVWFRKNLRFPNALLLIPIGVVTIWLVNAVRITALIAIGTSYSAEVAQSGFHAQVGWLAFNAVALCLVAIAWNMAFFSHAATPDETRESNVATAYPAAPYLAPFLVILASWMISECVAANSFDFLYPVRILAAIATLLYFREQYRSGRVLQLDWSWTAFAIGFAVFLVWRALEPLSGTTNAQAFPAMPLALAGTWLVFRIVGSVIVVPVAEELAFRGFLSRRLISDDFESVPIGQFTWFSFIVSASVFGLLHGRWIAGVFAGLMFSFAMYRRGRLGDAVLAHATANALITGYVLLSRDWSAWS
jgi:exosortase E/protease (VPEID-CTERM system)